MKSSFVSLFAVFAITQLEDMNENDLKRIDEKKMGELLRKKYPQMFD